MLSAMMSLYILPAIQFYMAYKLKQKHYAYIGLSMLIVIFSISLVGFEEFHIFLNDYFPFISGEGILWSLVALIIMIFASTSIYLFKLEASAKKRGHVVFKKDDFSKILVLEKDNIIFWFIILMYFIVSYVNRRI